MLTAACLALAAATYNVSPAAIQTVLSAPAEVGAVGPMHIPKAWLPILGRVGFAPIRVEHDPCTNIEAGAWILAFEALHDPHVSHAELPPIQIVPPAINTREANGSCVIKAAHFYHIPVVLLKAVLRTEGGHVGQIHENANGSYDMGPAQINSIWLPVLAQYGITRAMILNDGCLNISIGAWILAQAMAGGSPQNPAEFWRHVGDYNSHTPLWNQRYALKVWQNLPIQGQRG